ncbi:ABC transporter ATP-binding protein, partial [Citreimonas salinaria]
MADPTVALSGVTRRFGRHTAVEDVTFSLAPGQTVALVGHNGAGKTTLMKLMLGLIRPSAGTLAVLGQDPGRSFGARREIGFLPENVAFNPSLTAYELLKFYARLKGVRGDLRDVLAQVGLADAADRRVGTYSKGMRQRLGLAQALLGEPRLLLLDEPTTGLDPSLRLSFYETVQTLRGRGATVLLSSHALGELEQRAERVLIMHRGKLLADGTIAELRRLAELPVRMRLRVNGGWPEVEAALPPDTQVSRGADAIDLTCSETRKMEVIRSLAAAGPAVEDMEITPPSLDDLYA